MLSLKPQGAKVQQQLQALRCWWEVHGLFTLSLTLARSLLNWSGDALSHSSSPLLTLVESTSLHLPSLLLEAKHPHTCKHACKHTYMKNSHFSAQAHFVHKHVCAHAHWIFNLCPIFLPFWSSAMTAAFPRRQVFHSLAQWTQKSHTNTHIHIIWACNQRSAS